MTTKLKQLLQKNAASTLFDGTGDEAHDGKYYYIAGLECLLATIARAAVADGVSARTVMKMLVSGAFEVMDNPGATPGRGGETAAQVVYEAERLFSMLYPSQAEIEALKRDAEDFHASRSRH